MRLQVRVDIIVPDEFQHLCVVNSDPDHICNNYVAMCENGYCRLYNKNLRHVGIGKKPRKGQPWDNEGIKRCKACIERTVPKEPDREYPVIRGGAYQEPDRHQWSLTRGKARRDSYWDRLDIDQGFRCIK
jgi:hypothetical protein